VSLTLPDPTLALTPRWTTLRFHPEQVACWRSPARFVVNPAGRRSGKTEQAKRRLIYRALLGTDFPRPRFFAAAPTRDQAKRIYWQDLKEMVPAYARWGKPSESELVIRLVNGAELHVIGMDVPERIEGTPWDGGVLDEFANMKPQAWERHVRPALADRRGWCLFVGVPEGRNHYYQLYTRARGEMAAPGGEWAAYHWKSADILPPEEIEAARRDLDPLTFQQEMEASFVNFQGRTYYPFTDDTHCAKLEYDEGEPLALCFDFNVSPGVAVVVQEQDLPSGCRGTGVIDEVWIPRNSNTPTVLRALVERYRTHKGAVRIYGDATGGARGTAQVSGSDWEIISQVLHPVYGARMAMRVPRSNPAERSRVNAVNTRLKAGDGTVRLMLDPHKARHTVADLEGVRCLEGGSGEIDKKHDPELTHLSDALGYYIAYEFPVEGAGKVTTREMDFV
jgi:hypothetical protein